MYLYHVIVLAPFDYHRIMLIHLMSEVEVVKNVRNHKETHIKKHV